MNDRLIAHAKVKATGNVLDVAASACGIFYVSSDNAHESHSASALRRDDDRPPRLQRFRYRTPFQDGSDGVQDLVNEPEDLGEGLKSSTETLGPKISGMDCKRVSDLVYCLETLRKRGGNDDE